MKFKNFNVTYNNTGEDKLYLKKFRNERYNKKENIESKI
jgi:hypothetical protein